MLSHAAWADDDTIKIGVLHSLSGTMAMSEHAEGHRPDDHRRSNEKGGLLGKKVEAVVVDPASNWPLFAEKAGELLEKDHVAAIFGCWTSVTARMGAAGHGQGSGSSCPLQVRARNWEDLSGRSTTVHVNV